MTEHSRKGEILAPAGSVEQLLAAVNNGCDSVYLGLDEFNARMKAPNFTRENFAQWTNYCHLFGVKVYVTINTSLKNDEFARAVDLLRFVYLNKADGVIVTDLRLMKIASELPKPFEVVASTQLNVYDQYGAEFVKEYGASTVVCARESTLENIREIANVGIGVECFIHGATCVCQSGQCLFSAMVGGNSGNRGLCAQPCRKLYSADGKNWAYLLSARDLCGLDIAEKLQKVGVKTYKIEGRNRRAEYAGITSRVYGKLFDEGRCSQSDRDDLAEIYNRNMSELDYLHGGNANIISPDCQNHAGVAVGTVLGKNIKTVFPIEKGDGFKIFDGGREVCGAIALSSGTGLVAAEFGGITRNGMEVRRTTSVKLCQDIITTREKLSVQMTFEAYVGKNACITARCNGVIVKLCSDFVLCEAVQNATSAEEITKQLQKTGNSYYTISDIDIKNDNIFLAKSQINEMRRKVLEQLTNELLKEYDKRFIERNAACLDFCEIKKPPKRDSSPKLAVTCYSEEQLKASALADIKIYKPEVLDDSAFALCQNAYLDLPSFTTDAFLQTLLPSKPKIVCHNVGQVQFARKHGIEYIAGSGLNIYNDWMAECFSDAAHFVYSSELTLAEISDFNNRSGLIFVDGKITLMKLVHCPYKLIYGCKCENCAAKTPLTYRDEQRNNFIIVRRKAGRCSFELINGKKLSAAARIKKAGNYLVDYDPNVVAHYKNINDGVLDDYTEKAPYTKGRLFDKVN